MLVACSVEEDKGSPGVRIILLTSKERLQRLVCCVRLDFVCARGSRRWSLARKLVYFCRETGDGKTMDLCSQNLSKAVRLFSPLPTFCANLSPSNR